MHDHLTTTLLDYLGLLRCCGRATRPRTRPSASKVIFQGDYRYRPVTELSPTKNSLIHPSDGFIVFAILKSQAYRCNWPPQIPQPPTCGYRALWWSIVRCSTCRTVGGVLPKCSGLMIMDGMCAQYGGTESKCCSHSLFGKTSRSASTSHPIGIRLLGQLAELMG